MVVLYLNLHKATFKGARNRFWIHLHHFMSFRIKSKSAIFAGSNIHNLSPDPQKGVQMVKIRGFWRVLRVHGVKGKIYIVTFWQEAVRGPQKWSKMSIFLLKMDQNHQKSRNLRKCASKQRVQIHGFLKTTKKVISGLQKASNRRRLFAMHVKWSKVVNVHF